VPANDRSGRCARTAPSERPRARKADPVVDGAIGSLRLVSVGRTALPRRTATRRTALISLGLGAALCCSAPPATAQNVEVVADGLVNPRGMAFGLDGRLYVAEAGSGGAGPCFTGADAQQCVGATGAIASVDVRTHRVKRIVTGLPSVAPQTGANPGRNANGPNDISFKGRVGYFTIGLAANPAVRGTLGPLGEDLATLNQMTPNGHVRRIADLGAYEASANPDAALGGAPDTNPFSVDASHPGPMLVTDAGGNDLLRVSRGGGVQTVAVFPSGRAAAPPFLGLPPGAEIPYQPVPTGLTRAADGTPVVGQLTGFPFPAGRADVYAVDSATPTVLHAGFTNIVDVAAGPDDSLYVLQISAAGLLNPAAPGKLLHVAADGARTELLAGRLQRPTGLTVSRSGDVYVANRGSTTNAEILRIDR
jgi:hypothetical protein